MKDFTPTQFLDWFCDEIHRKSQLDLLNEIVGVMSRHSGKKIAVTVFTRPNLPHRFIARMDVLDGAALASLQSSLRCRTLQVQPGCWTEGRSIETGAICHVAGKVVTLIKADGVVKFDVQFQKYDFVVDGSR